MEKSSYIVSCYFHGPFWIRSIENAHLTLKQYFCLTSSFWKSSLEWFEDLEFSIKLRCHPCHWRVSYPPVKWYWEQACTHVVHDNVHGGVWPLYFEIRSLISFGRMKVFLWNPGMPPFLQSMDEVVHIFTVVSYTLNRKVHKYVFSCYVHSILCPFLKESEQQYECWSNIPSHTQVVLALTSLFGKGFMKIHRLD